MANIVEPASVVDPVADTSLEEKETPPIEKYGKALKEFKEPEEAELLVIEENSIRQHPSNNVEGYFEWASRHGKPLFSWDVIQPAFIWKVKFVMDEMLRLDRTRLKEGETLNFSEESPLKLGYDFIVERSREFEGAPFTWQRICELLHTPLRHYKKAEKFVRALDKTINVVTTLTADGVSYFRISGAEWPMPENPAAGKVEQHFFGKVDEVDAMEQKLEESDSASADLETTTITDKVVGPMLPPAGPSGDAPLAAEEGDVAQEATDAPMAAADDQAEPIDMSTKAKEEDASKEEQMET